MKNNDNEDLIKELDKYLKKMQFSEPSDEYVIQLGKDALEQFNTIMTKEANKDMFGNLYLKKPPEHNIRFTTGLGGAKNYLKALMGDYYKEENYQHMKHGCYLITENGLEFINNNLK